MIDEGSAANERSFLPSGSKQAPTANRPFFCPVSLPIIRLYLQSPIYSVDCIFILS